MMFTRISRRVRHPFHREEGQAGFEFMLILPLFFTFFLLMIEFGLAMYQFVSIANGVREGARYAAVNCGDGNCAGGADATTPQGRTVARSAGFLTNAEVTVEWTGTNRGDAVVVRAADTYNALFFPLPGMSLKSCAQMRLERKDDGSVTVNGSATC
jgi:Flp pilus assembly protein TadG